MDLIIMGSLCGLLSVWIAVFIVFFRRNLTSMVGMMAAMCLGMTSGLAMGSLLAIWLPGQFFESTMFGMLIGGAIGVVTGAPISLMAVLDGLLSGMMGGMMGTMLMVMMPSPYAGLTVKIMSVLCCGIMFLLFILLQGEIKIDVLKQRSFLLSNPLFMFAVIILAFVFILLTSPHQNSNLQMSPPGQTHEDSGHDHHSSNTLGLRESDHELLIKATEFPFSPAAILFPIPV
ncbi:MULTISPECIES: hypothetical protein [Paenibacillus]|uniref:Uncharacterized protein n=1 Tax=Paenibacillus albilobatus TaxID=2716884 RepID=A0A919XB28_9BACL|nr:MULTISPECIES: hypothetical protein [Paenibacillus]GIO28876.1 hypothetical protein J2TS6_00170 [Paenibacillus albilobatus]